MAGCNWASIRNESNPEDYLTDFADSIAEVLALQGSIREIGVDFVPEIHNLQIGTFESCSRILRKRLSTKCSYCRKELMSIQG